MLVIFYVNFFPGQVNYGAFDSTPTSFLITAGIEDNEYAAFVARYRDIVKGSLAKESIPQKHCETNMWLVKPANLNQGNYNNIYLFLPFSYTNIL